MKPTTAVAPRARALAAAALVTTCALALGQGSPDAAAVREGAYRTNNRGVALLEQYQAEAAVKAFRDALALDPRNTLARVNLAIALLNVPDFEAADTAASAALQAVPNSPQAWYVRGLVARSQNRTTEAAGAFDKVLAVDAADVGARVNLGQLALLSRDYEKAITQFKAATEAEPYNGTALYNLGIALVRAGRSEEGQKALDHFQALKEMGAATMIGQNYPEQGRYAEAVLSTGDEADLVDTKEPAVRFVEATKDFGIAPGPAVGKLGSALIFDWNQDEALDLLVTGNDGIDPGWPPDRVKPAGRGNLRLYENRHGKFVDVTAASGLPASLPAFAGVAADVDNDNDVDLVLLTSRGLRLFKREAQGFVDATEGSGIALESAVIGAALTDFDHDGDVDLVAGRVFPDGRVRLFQNDGTGRFADITKAALGDRPPRATTVIPTDFDNRRDMDLVFVDAVVGMLDAPNVYLFQNQRDRTFRDVATAQGLGDVPAAVAAAGDVNKDGFTDFFFTVDGRSSLAMSRGGRGYEVVAAPPSRGNPAQAQFLDYDNDGLLDLLVSGADGLKLFRNTGGRFAAVTAPAVPGGSLGYVATGDLDGDGDAEIVALDKQGSPHILRNDGGSRNHSLRVQLQGFVSNRSGVGAKVDMRAGSLHQKLETSSVFPPLRPADVVFGLGQRAAADAVRVIWPSGTMQAEAPEPKAAAMKIVELDRKPSSCPYLYAWDGERFGFITDFMGGGEMGYRFPNGAFNMPDPVEYVRLGAEQLRPRNGRYELRITNELEELLYVDRVRLVAVDHAAAVEVQPNEGMVSQPPTHRLFAAAAPRPVRAAFDDAGRDVTADIAQLDDRSPAGFGLSRVRGYAADHSLTLDLGGGPADLLLLTGWTDYAFSSDNVAAGQAGLALHPPSLQMRDAAGAWQTVIAEVGIPVGRPQTLTLDLADKWLAKDRQVRIVTNMRIYWDEVRVAAAADQPRAARHHRGPRHGRFAGPRLLARAHAQRAAAHHLRLHEGERRIALEGFSGPLHAPR